MTESLSRLVYSSRSMLAGTAADRLAGVGAILRSSRARNARAGLTGVLMFDGASFLQVVEGPAAEVERVYEVIACDQRHENLEVLDLATVDRREYAAWSMAFVEAGSDEHGPLRCRLSRLSETQCVVDDSFCASVRLLLHAQDQIDPDGC